MPAGVVTVSVKCLPSSAHCRPVTRPSGSFSATFAPPGRLTRVIPVMRPSRAGPLVRGLNRTPASRRIGSASSATAG